MTDRDEQRGDERAGPAELRVELESPLPRSWPVGSAGALFCYGTCHHPPAAVRAIEIVVDGIAQPVAALNMPRADLIATPAPDAAGPSAPAHGGAGRCRYRSGFWGTVGVSAPSGPGAVELQAAVTVAGGARWVVPLARVEVLERAAPTVDGGDWEAGVIAVCMATCDPDIGLFRAQVDSLRAQTDPRWRCLISDDCSGEESFAEILTVLDADPRFVVCRSPRRLGFYRNFERALMMVPDEAQLIALCDHDDRWDPDKLRTLRDALGEAQLVYSDQRLVDAAGRLLRDTLWKGRRNNHTDLASLLVANTITGAATLFRRDVARRALPFPDTPGLQFHDHWIGLVALASGAVGYVDRPLYDYVQHRGAVFGEVTLGGPAPRRAAARRLARWRAAYFCGYLSREVQAQVLLARCADVLTPHKRRVLQRFVGSVRSPAGFAWLALRPLRALVGRNETLGGEAALAQGIIWRWLIGLRGGRRCTPGRPACDASFPDPMSFEQKRLRRWRARI
jgi:glycosyl transferase family 2